MQKLAAYLLERPNHTDDRAQDGDGVRLRSLVQQWLLDKGACSIGQRGTYSAEDGSNATYEIHEAFDTADSWILYRLTEIASGRRFDTAISVTVTAPRVAVYCTLEVGSTEAVVNRIQAEPRCPRIIRTILEMPGEWWLGPTQLRGLTTVEGFSEGEALAEQIQQPERSIPYLIISTVQGKPALEKLGENLARDLAGLARVCLVDEQASWALTDRLGKWNSCFAGGLRLYWPRFSLADPFGNPLWTATRLIAPAFDVGAFRRQLRLQIMSAAATSITRPLEIEGIRNAAQRAEYATLKKNASSLRDFEKLADTYARDNDELRTERDLQYEEIRRLQQRLSASERDCSALRYHLRQVKPDSLPEKEDEISPDSVEQPASPIRGETRYYKKRDSAPAHDIMVRTNACGHDAWQSAAKADKAKKGIAKLEARNDWEAIHHCGSCTGGGLWRVTW